MCTVTYIPTGSTTYITSNRDENKQRKKAALPQTEVLNGQQITFPKDPVAGGSWFVLSEKGIVAVLLNGADKKHLPAYPYRKSRGLILLELASDAESLHAFKKIDLDNIEPFTIVFFDHAKLYQLQWDGYKKTQRLLDHSSPYIWSSTTLYPENIIQHRKKLFDRFISNSAELTAEKIIQFHQSNHEDPENGFIINRENGILTQSVSQAIIENNSLHFTHHDLLNNQISKSNIPLTQAPVV